MRILYIHIDILQLFPYNGSLSCPPCCLLSQELSAFRYFLRLLSVLCHSSAFSVLPVKYLLKNSLRSRMEISERERALAPPDYLPRKFFGPDGTRLWVKLAAGIHQCELCGFAAKTKNKYREKQGRHSCKRTTFIIIFLPYPSPRRRCICLSLFPKRFPFIFSSFYSFLPPSWRIFPNCRAPFEQMYKVLLKMKKKILIHFWLNRKVHIFNFLNCGRSLMYS